MFNNKDTEETKEENKLGLKHNHLKLIINSLATILAVFVTKYLIDIGVISFSGWSLTVVVWCINLVLRYNTYLILTILLVYALDIISYFFKIIFYIIGTISLIFKKGGV